MASTPVKPRILIADDEPGIRELLRELLSQNGAEVSAVENGAEAVWEASHAHYDACIFDIEMPQMNGLEACRRLRALPATAALPIIFLTMCSDAETIQQAFAAGGTDYLSKPVYPALLWNRLANVLHIAQLEEETRRLREVIKVLEFQRNATPAKNP